MTFAAVAGETRRYEIVDFIRAAFGNGVNVVDLKQDGLRWGGATISAAETIALENIEPGLFL